jgi:hypothetical protein
MSLSAIAQSWGTPAGSALGGYALAALINRKATNREADAADRQAKTADWSAHTASVHEFNEQLSDRLEKVEDKLDAAETRLDAAEERADVAEGRYRIAITYIRQIAEWVAERLPGHGLPTPPPELEADL